MLHQKMASAKKFDIVVFGASGFTGQFVVEELARTASEEAGIKWAIAGRSMSKLQHVLTQASKYTGGTARALLGALHTQWRCTLHCRCNMCNA